MRHGHNFVLHTVESELGLLTPGSAWLRCCATLCHMIHLASGKPERTDTDTQTYTEKRACEHALTHTHTQRTQGSARLLFSCIFCWGTRAPMVMVTSIPTWRFTADMSRPPCRGGGPEPSTDRARAQDVRKPPGSVIPSASCRPTSCGRTERRPRPLSCDSSVRSSQQWFQVANVRVQQAVKDTADVMQMGKMDELYATPAPVVEHTAPASAVVAAPAFMVPYIAPPPVAYAAPPPVVEDFSPVASRARKLQQCTPSQHQLACLGILRRHLIRFFVGVFHRNRCSWTLFHVWCHQQLLWTSFFDGCGSLPRCAFDPDFSCRFVRMGNHAKRVNVRCALGMMRAVFT